MDFGTLGQITGSVLADRALITFGGALLGFGVDKLSGGSGWKGAAIGGAMAFGATYLPPINFGSGGGGAIGGIDAGANVARAGFGMLNTSVKEAVANAPMGVSLSSREPLIMQANISKTPAVRGRVIVGDATDMVPQKVVVPTPSPTSTANIIKVKAGFNIDKAVNWLNTHSHSSFPAAKSAGDGARCAYFVRMALEAGGINTTDHPVPARLYNNYLVKWGFKAISINELPAKLMSGDIAVIQGYPGGTADKNGVAYGHIQMYNGKQWLSNWKQQAPFWPGKGYKLNTPSFKIYRW